MKNFLFFGVSLKDTVTLAFLMPWGVTHKRTHSHFFFLLPLTSRSLYSNSSKEEGESGGKRLSVKLIQPEELQWLIWNTVSDIKSVMTYEKKSYFSISPHAHSPVDVSNLTNLLQVDISIWKITHKVSLSFKYICGGTLTSKG